LVDMY